MERRIFGNVKKISENEKIADTVIIHDGVVIEIYCHRWQLEKMQ